MTAAQIVNGYNLAWGGVGLVMFALLVHVAWRTPYRRARLTAMGLALIELGIAARMLFWYLAGALAPAGVTYAPWAIDNRGWLLIPIVGAMVGALVVIRSLIGALGSHWWVVGVGAPIALFFIGAYTA